MRLFPYGSEGNSPESGQHVLTFSWDDNIPVWEIAAYWKQGDEAPDYRRDKDPQKTPEERLMESIFKTYKIPETGFFKMEENSDGDLEWTKQADPMYVTPLEEPLPSSYAGMVQYSSEERYGTLTALENVAREIAQKRQAGSSAEEILSHLDQWLAYAAVNNPH